MPTAPEKLDPERSITETIAALRSSSAVFAAGEPVPDSFLALVWKLATASMGAIATAEGKTPRQVLEEAFKVTPSADEWTTTLLPQRAETGRRLLAAAGDLDLGKGGE
jgi:hypothetical protein